MRNIFLQESYTKYRGGTSSRPISEKSKISVSLEQQSGFLYSLKMIAV